MPCWYPDTHHFHQFDTAFDEAEYIADDVREKERDGKVSFGGCAVLYRTNDRHYLIRFPQSVIETDPSAVSFL